MNTRTKIAASGLVIAALAATTTPAFASNTSVKAKATSHSRHINGSLRQHVGPLAALVAAGTITQANGDAVETATHTAMQAAELANFKAALAALVANNTITQALADAAIAALPSNPTPSTGRAPMAMREHANLATWTVAQRTALRTWLDANPIDRAAISKAAVAQLVTAGTLTQAQADAVNAALAAFAPKGMGPDGDRGRGRMGERGEHRGHGPRGGQFSMHGTVGAVTPQA